MTIATDILDKIDHSKNEAYQVLDLAPKSITKQGILPSEYGEYKNWMFIVFKDESVIFYSHNKAIDGDNLYKGSRTS